MICEQAGHGAAGGALADLLGTFRPFTVENCGAIKVALARVQALAMQARRGSEEAAA
ncbi:MAG TPA: hypothetical protein VH877_10870 [Polyangia bacterium]|jgi:hypothetical protein|nr:hypothetical protein [Polyangia bacterium]